MGHRAQNWDCQNQDIYIMLPGVLGDKRRLEKASVKPTGQCAQFLEHFWEIAGYECSSELPAHLERLYLGDYCFACSDDNYEIPMLPVLPRDRLLSVKPCSVYVTVNWQTSLAIVLLSIPQCVYDATLIADQISMEYLYLGRSADGEFRLLRECILEWFQITQLDVPKAMFSMGQYDPGEDYYKCLLGGTAYRSQYVDYRLSSRKISTDAERNIAVFDFYEAYVSSNILVFYLKSFSNRYQENICDEIEMLFICELALLQNSAIAKTNYQIIHQLSSPTKISLKTIEDMHTEFGKAIRFWNQSNFQYAPVQELFSEIQDAFGNPRQLKDYRNNQEYLEHIVSIKSSRSSERESKIINFIAIILAVIQIIPIILEWTPGEFNGKIVSASTLGALGLFAIVYLLIRVQHQRRNRRARAAAARLGDSGKG